MKTLKDYILGASKELKFKARFAVEITDEAVDRIERALGKYELIKISSPKKTIFQKNPIGFDEPLETEVSIIEFVVARPASSFVLKRELAKLLGISDIYVAVHGEHEPLEGGPKLTNDSEKDTKQEEAVQIGFTPDELAGLTKLAKLDPKKKN